MKVYYKGEELKDASKLLLPLHITGPVNLQRDALAIRLGGMNRIPSELLKAIDAVKQAPLGSFCGEFVTIWLHYPKPLVGESGTYSPEDVIREIGKVTLTDDRGGYFQGYPVTAHELLWFYATYYLIITEGRYFGLGDLVGDGYLQVTDVRGGTDSIKIHPKEELLKRLDNRFLIIFRPVAKPQEVEFVA